MPESETQSSGTVVLVSDHGSSGGTRTYAMQLLDLYGRMGLGVHLVRTMPESDAELEELLDRWGFSTSSYADVVGQRSFRGSGLPDPWSRRTRRRERQAFSDFLEGVGCDLVVASVGNPGSLLGVVAARSPSLYVMHTYPHGTRVRYLGRWWFRRAAFEASRIVTVSFAARQELIRLWGLGDAHDRVEVVHSTSGDPLPLDDVIGSASRLVLTVGHVEEYKRPIEWIGMAERLLRTQGHTDVRFTWAGDGSLLETCRSEVIARGIEDRVTFPGVVSDLAPLYSGASVYVQPSRVESLGLALLEAGRYGVPSVVTNVGGMPEVVESGVTGLVVKSAAPDVLAGAVAAVLLSEDVRVAMGDAARSRYDREFAKARWELAMSELHTELLGG